MSCSSSAVPWTQASAKGQLTACLRTVATGLPCWPHTREHKTPPEEHCKVLISLHCVPAGHVLYLPRRIHCLRFLGMHESACVGRSRQATASRRCETPAGGARTIPLTAVLFTAFVIAVVASKAMATIQVRNGTDGSWTNSALVIARGIWVAIVNSNLARIIISLWCLPPRRRPTPSGCVRPPAPLRQADPRQATSATTANYPANIIVNNLYQSMFGDPGHTLLGAGFRATRTHVFRALGSNNPPCPGFGVTTPLGVITQSLSISRTTYVRGRCPDPMLPHPSQYPTRTQSRAGELP